MIFYKYNIAILFIIQATTCMFGQSSLNISDIAEPGNNPRFLKIRKEITVSASDFLSRYRTALGAGTGDEIVLKQTEGDELGCIHYRYQQYHNGIPVLDGELILHEKNGRLYSVNGQIISGLTSGKSVAIPENMALHAATKFINAKKYLWEIQDSTVIGAGFAPKEHPNVPAGEIVYVLNPQNGEQVQAYKFEVVAVEPYSEMVVFVDVQTGEVIYGYSLQCNIDQNGTAETRYSGTRNIKTTQDQSGIYILKETGRGGGIETLNLNNNTEADIQYATNFTDADNNWNLNGAPDQVATDAHWGMEMTYDYYLNKHARNSYNNSGGKIYSYVHTEQSLNNAFWSHTSQRMFFGDGDGLKFKPLTSLDVAGHEFTHGITQYTANLYYFGETGALNESFSDIFGTAIESYANPGSWNWTIGEDIMVDTTTFLRSMSNPKDPKGSIQPNTYNKGTWVPIVGCVPDHRPKIGNDGCWVHTNSGVQNHWFYLLSAGGSGQNDNGNDYAVKGIGIDKAAKIAYRNLAHYLTSNAQYMDARDNAIQAAVDLFGECSNEVVQTTNAWYAVGVGDRKIMIDALAFQKPDCNMANGNATVSVGGTDSQNISYNWSNGQTSQMATGLGTGTYTVTVTSISTGCKVDTTFSIPENSNFTVTISKTDISTCGAMDGTAIATPSTTSGTYLYQWSNSQNTGMASALAKGIYTVSITDINTTCVVVDSTEINEPGPSVIINGGGIRTFCDDNPNQVITLTASAANCNECMFIWSTGATGNSINVTAKGFYKITATNTGGCSGSDSTDVTIYLRDCDDCRVTPGIRFGGVDKCKEWTIPILTSRDPNSITGPPGFGTPKWVSINDNLLYTIRFENDPGFATAPAQRVEIGYTLDEDLNLFSVRLGDFGFANMLFEVPPNTTFYNTRLDVRDSLGVFVDVSAGIDVTADRVFWIFQAVDPSTGLAPQNPLLGLLPVNDTLFRRGEGFADFTVRPKSSALTGDSILAEAAIIFDQNETINTPPIFNVIDALPPVSTLTGMLPATTDSMSFTISWSGHDDAGGCGVRDYALYASENNGVFVPYQTGIPDTFTVFKGQAGNTYTFFTSATDNVGNTEALKTQGEQSVSINERRILNIFAINRDSFCAGDSLVLLWSASGIAGVDIYISPDSGTSWQQLAAAWAADSSFFGWRIAPDFVGCTHCLLLVADTSSGSVGRDTIFTIIHPTPAVANPSIINVTCPGESDGVIALSVSGGTMPYQYLWSDDQVTANAINLVAGVYTATVTDMNGCADTVSAIVGVGAGDDLFARAQVKAFLQGPYVPAEQLMHDSLRVKGLIPLTEPYTGLANFTHVNGGGEQTTASVLAVTGPDAIVDWVFLELRSAANPTLVLATRSALLQRDGDVVDVDGVSPVLFGVAAGPDYYPTVRHRNHLGVELGAEAPYPICEAVETDFRSTPPEGFYDYNGLNPAQKLVSGVFVLWAGNGRIDYQLKYNGSNNDRTAILGVVGLATPNAVVPGYNLADYNLDGQVKYNGSANDRNVLLGNVGITTPSALVYDQVGR